MYRNHHLDFLPIFDIVTKFNNNFGIACALVLLAFVLHKHILFSIQADPDDMPENHFGKLLSSPANILEALLDRCMHLK